MIENSNRLSAVVPINRVAGLLANYRDCTGVRLEQAVSTADPNTPPVDDLHSVMSTQGGALVISNEPWSAS